MSAARTVMIVEDEPKLARLIADYLAADNLASQWIADGTQVEPAVRAHPPQLVLLDLMLPGRDGLSICKDLRQFTDVPIIMVTARVEEVDRLLGLEIGADDYICKPFSPRELVARVKAVLCRSDVPSPALPFSAGITANGFTFGTTTTARTGTQNSLPTRRCCSGAAT